MGVQLEIDLLGKFRACYGEEPLQSLNSPRLQELLTYLIVYRDSPQQRQHVALNFWPDSPAKQTLANLRQLLFQLRNALPESERYIRSDSNTVQWNSEAPARIDLVEFEEAITEARRRVAAGEDEKDLSGEVAALETAVEQYGGPLLPHCFEEWIAGKRHRLREEYTDALERLVERYEEQRKFERGIVYAGKLVEQNPTDEAAVRKLMQLHAFNDDRAAVVRTYRKLEERMGRELDIEPGQKTNELYQRLTRRDEKEEEPGPERKRERGRADGSGSPLALPDENWPLVGRNEEWKRLVGVWKKARTGVMQCVVIRGETGIGKSRLGREFLAHLGRQGYGVAWARCQEAPGTPGYGPLAQWLRSASFRPRIEELDPVWRTEVARLLPEFSGSRRGSETEAGEKKKSEAEEAGKVMEPAPQGGERKPWLQTRFEEALARAMLQEGKPAALMLDGIQWCDPETLGWFNYLMNRNRPAPLLLVAAMRTPLDTASAPNEPLESLLLALRRNHSLYEIDLEPLDRESTVELASLLLDRELDRSMGRLIYEDTEGNPLFTVETAREIDQLEELKDREEDGFTAPDETRSRLRSLPRVVSDVISDRFRYLSSNAKLVLGIAAVAGRSFSFVHIRRCCDLGVAELVEALEELVDRQILQEIRPEWYDFRHDKLREVAYNDLGEMRKRRLHRSMAVALLEVNIDDPAALHLRMAFHCERAGDIREAVEHYRMAARYSGRGTVRQDIGMLERALELLEKIPEGEERDHRELEITTALALAMLQRRNFDREEVFRICTRVHQLCSHLGEPPPITILMALGIANLWSGDPATAVELGTVMHTLSGEMDDYQGYSESCYLLGLSHRILGNIAQSAKWCRKGMDYHRYVNVKGQPFVHLRAYDLDGGVLLKMETACGLLLTGNTAEAREMMRRTLEEAADAGRPLDIACVNIHTAFHEMLLRNPSEAREAIKEFLTAEMEVEPLYWTVQAEMIQGWIAAAGGSPMRGAGRIRKGIERMEADNRTIDLPIYYGLLCEALTDAGEFEEAAEALERAREIMADTGAQFALAEIHRAEGHLLHARSPGDREAAGKAFTQALETAKQQDCRLFQQRAAAEREQF